MQPIKAYIGIGIIAAFLTGCSNDPEVVTENPNIVKDPVLQEAPQSYTLDHVVICVKDSTLHQRLSEILTPAEKLTTLHKEQGTFGQYFLLYNTFIELLYLNDEEQAKLNEPAFRSAYTQRWNPTACPIAIGVTIAHFDSTRADVPFVGYSNADLPQGEYYLMASGNTDLRSPMIYASMPYKAYKSINYIEEVEQTAKPEVQEDLKQYLSHPSGIQKLTGLKIYIPEEHLSSENSLLVANIEGIQVVRGNGAYGLEMEFDDYAQHKKVVVQDQPRVWVSY